MGLSLNMAVGNEVLSTVDILDENCTSYDPALVFTDSIPKLPGILLDFENHSVDDIVRDLDGFPLSKEYLAHNMGINNVDSYTCPEQDAFRGFMSDACRVQLRPGGETAFYKRIVFEDLDHAWDKLKNSPFKLRRDAKSYQVVASFLSSEACQDMKRHTGVCIPKCYDVQLRTNDANPIESKYSFLLEDFSPSDGWYQEWLLCDMKECKKSLSMFAKIHAFFWHGSSFWKNDVQVARDFEAGIWKSGSYVQPEAQNTKTVNQCKIVAKEWATKRLRFEKELSSFDYWDNLGERLESMAEECGRLAHPFADDSLSESCKKYRTFTHGDPKAANLFFRHDSTKSELQVGLIDFQWSGFGLAATDIAHFLTSGVHADLLVNGGELRLLRYYFDELQTHLVEFGAYSNAAEAAKSFRYGKFIDQYEIGVLDICRLMIAYTWSRFDEPAEKDDKEACVRTMNKTSYNKSIPTIVWLLSRCDEIMKSRGV
jgi:thiamine kinase-like enzyme